MNEFDQHAGDYSAVMDSTVGWTGQDHDFFNASKARLLTRLARAQFGDIGKIQAIDIGCGVGLIDRFLVPSIPNLHGIDVSAQSIERAQRNCPEASFRSFDGKHIPYADGAFDMAIATCVMHHVPPQDWPAFMTEMARVLKPGGLAVVIEHNPLNPVTRHMVTHHEFDRDAVMLSLGTCKKLFRGANFKIAKARFTTFVPFALPFLDQIEGLLGPLPLGAQYFLAGLKPAESA
jgi:ubiquinone/menaquinone biosynthesis C-methylase UbiE